ncbi:ComEC/Rec2 family competence protein [Oceanobacillus salinisoli]|uniref:ComEC/Rec2 family competence protein n=1 Tax=Oceanobacillus salinisoli TaxID=2678611 RepID=UPI0012E26978|nr:MBL fold metallo-hydrolase [Oceanobacillus salinisoli]
MKKINIVIAVILFFNTITIQQAFAQQKPDMDVHFIDVGQGDSILIQTPADKTILIDGGPPVAGDKVISYLKEQNIEDIDLLIATHPDYDHIGGLVNVLRSFNVKQVLDTGKIHLTTTFAKYVREIRKQEIPAVIAKPNQNINIDPHVNMKVLNAYEKNKTNNQSSIVLKMSYDDVDFLLMSDAEMEQEKELLEKYDVESEIMKIAHHGSDTSTSYEFLREVSPETAILTYSVHNDYGHPVERVVENLTLVDAKIFSTATFGDLVISTDGDDYYVYPKRGPADNITRKAA